MDINDFTDYNLTTFLSLIEEQRLDDLLDRGGIFTVFAPTDAAFEQTTVITVSENLPTSHISNCS